MNRPLLVSAAAAFASFLSPNLSAQAVTSVANGAWDVAPTWSDALAPSSGKNYQIDGELVNSPNLGANGSRTFAGSSLLVSSGELQLKVEHNSGGVTGTFSIPSFSLGGGSLVFDASNGTTTWNFNSDINLATSTTSKMIIRDGNFGTTVNLNGFLTGTGNIAVEANRSDTDDDRAFLHVRTSNPGFSGNWTAQGFDTGAFANIRASAANALGSGTVTLLDRGALLLDTNNGINSLAGITLSNSTSKLDLANRAWTNAAASLTVTAGTVTGTNSAVSIGSYTQAAGTVTLSSLATSGAFAQSGGALTLGTTATVGGNLTSGGTLNLAVAPAAPARVAVTGNAGLAGSVMNVAITGNPIGQSFNLLSYGGTLTGSPTVNVSGDSGRLTPVVNTGTGTNDVLTLSFTGSVASLVWTGGTSSDWDNNITQNFDNGGSPDVFRSYDNVLFTDGAFATTPQIVGNLSAGTVTFSGTGGYTLGGAGALVGPTSLVKSGSHVLVIANTGTNTFTGAITINEGTLQVGNGGTAGSLGTGAIANEGELVFNRTDAITIANAISGSGSLAQSGTGTTILTGNNTYGGDTFIDAGTLQIGNGGTTGSLGTGAILLNGTLAINRSDAVAIPMDISGTGSFTQSGAGTTTLGGTNAYAGTTGISNGTLATNGGDNRLPVTTAVAFSNTGTLALGTSNQTISTISVPVGNASSASTITGSGSLLVNGPVPFNFGTSGSLNAPRSTSLDLTGLAAFEFNSPGQTFRVGTLAGTTSSATNFGSTTFLGSASTTIKALSFLFGDQAGTGSGGTNTFRLGQTNVIHANTINMGASGRSNVTFNFNSGLTAPTLAIRGTDGIAPVTNWEVGRVANFGPSVTTWNANVDLSAGEINALVTTLKVGINNPTAQPNRAGIQNSTFLMGDGSLTVTNLIIGEHAGTGAVSGTYTANGTFTLNHPDGIVTATSLRLAENTGSVTGAGRSVNGTLNLDNGTLAAGEIRLGNQTAADPAAVTRNFNFSGGTLTHLSGQDLAITNVPVKLSGGGSRVFTAATGRAITIAADAPITEAGGFSKQGAGSLVLLGANTYAGDTFLDGGTLGGTGSSASVLLAAAGTTVAPGASIGTMATAGATFSAGATLAIEIDSSTDTADKLTAAGAVDISGASVTFTEIGSGVIPAGTKLVILDYTGQTLTGTFAGLAEGATVNVGSNSFTLSYTDAQRVTLTSTTAGDAYSTWAAAAGLDDTPGKEADFDADPDDDGLANGLEWVLGGNPLDGDAGALVDISATATGGLTLEFTREPASVGVAGLFVDFDNNLDSPWAKSATIGAASTPADTNGVTVTIVPGPPDDVTVNIPASNAGTEERIFARLRAEKP